MQDWGDSPLTVFPNRSQGVSTRSGGDVLQNPRTILGVGKRV